MRKSYELYFALCGILAVTVLYVPFALRGMPRASSLIGHGIGILGFVLMLATETLYSLRKRMRGRALGRMSTWLQFHIFTGVVGPYMVMLHSSGKLNGLAGVTMLLTAVVVASGFVGRYIYTAVPRTAEGAEVALQDLATQIARANAQLQAWTANRPEEVAALATGLAALSEGPQSGAMLVLARPVLDWQYRLRLRREMSRLEATGQAQLIQLRKLLDQRQRLQREMHSLAMARRLLALWHTIHIPLGVALFSMAFVHIGAAIYFATLLK